MQTEQGHATAQYELGKLCLNGDGAANEAEALKWFILAAKAGEPAAAQRSARLQKTMPPAQVEDALKKAEEKLA